MALATGDGERFSLADLHPPGVAEAIKFRLVDRLIPDAFSLLQRVRPVARVPFTQWFFVTGFDANQEVFSRPGDFVTPYESKCEVLGWRDFMLALPDGERYRHILEQTRSLWRAGDLDQVRAITRNAARAAINDAGSDSFDFIQNYSVRAALAVVEEYYGVPLPQLHQPFFDGVLFGSGFVFGLPNPSPEKERMAQKAMREVWPVIDDAMAAQRAHPREDTVLGRYFADPELQAQFSTADMRSAIMAMIGGFLPTNTNGNGRILETLFRIAPAMADARAAATAGDLARLLSVLHEAMRLKYILPMLWRRATKDTVLGVGTDREIPVPAGSTIVLSNQVAMKDRRRIPNPERYDPDRSRHQYMLYGHDFHYCVGAAINDVMLEELFGALLTQDVARTGSTRWVGMYPWQMPIRIGAKDNS